jgi:hypothetical protein
MPHGLGGPMWVKPRRTCMMCGDNNPEDRLLTCSHDCYVAYKAAKRRGKLPGHKVRLDKYQRREITLRIKSEKGGKAYSKMRAMEPYLDKP